MADITFTSAATTPAEGWFWRMITRVAEARAERMGLPARQQEIARLQALSDAELAKLGLTRDGIVRHVLRDIYYL